MTRRHAARRAPDELAARVTAELRGAGAALAFLTRVPVPGAAGFDGADLARGTPFFPLAGGVTGAAVGGGAALLAGPCPPVVAAGLALALGAVLTGAIHLDGLADAADALGGRSREQALAIMRDPRAGTYGVVAVVIVLVVEAAALAELAARDEVLPVIAAFALARAAAPLLACLLPPAREDGLGRALARRGRGRALVSALVACGSAALLAPGRAPASIATAALCSCGAVLLYRRRFGGVSGDLLGAAIAVTEAACVVLAASA